MTGTINPPTYPARPLNGGALDCALPKRGEWRIEAKYNGWRALVHAPSGAMFNRQLERLSIEKEFAHALAKLRALPVTDVTWFDCEALERRHKLGRGTLIILDLVVPKLNYTERRLTLAALGLPAPFAPDMFAPDTIYVAPSYQNEEAEALYQSGQWANQAYNCEFYEGIVCKRADAPYPFQRINATRETTDWIKHRWRA